MAMHLTTKAQPRRTSDVARAGGPANAIRSWLQRFVRRIESIAHLLERVDARVASKLHQLWCEQPANPAGGLQLQEPSGQSQRSPPKQRAWHQPSKPLSCR